MNQLIVSQTILYELFLVFFATTAAVSPISPKVWLSEYGYIKETTDEIQKVTFPVNQRENILNTSFLSKTDGEVVVHRNLSFVVFTCEAEYPVSWFVNQELKPLSEDLKTGTYQFLSPSNISGDQNKYFRSLIVIYLQHLEYDSDTDKFLVEKPVEFGKWKFSCCKTNTQSEYCEDTSIILKLEQNSDTKLSDSKLEEKIIIAILTKQNNNSLEAPGFDLNSVMGHYSNFENQTITLGTNFTINITELEDTDVEYTKLVEYEHNERIKEGDLIQIICFSSRTLYSYGASVGIIWENGTETRLSEEIYKFDSRPLIKFTENSKLLANKFFTMAEAQDPSENMLYFLSKEIKVDLGMKRINCNMPVWVDGKFDQVSRDFNVIPK